MRQTKDSFRLYKSTERHNKNMREEQKKIKEKQLNDKEKILKKYTNYFFFKKNREKELQLKAAKSQRKLLEKAEKLEEIEKNEQLKKNELIKKLNTVEKNKSEMKLKNKKDDFLLFTKKRKEYNKNCKKKRLMLLRELSDIRLDILDYQAYILKRNIEKEKMNELRKNQSTDKTLYDQLNLKKNMRPFFKKMDQLKSDNIMKKSVDNRRKLFFQKKEKKKKRKKKKKKN